MDKRKIIVYGVLAFIILLTVIYAVSIFSKKGAVAENTDFVIPEMVEKEQAKDDYNSRLKNANAYQEPEKRKDIDETVQFKTYDNDKKREVKRNETDYTESNQTVQRRVVKVETKKVIQEEQKTNEITTVKEEKKEDNSGGFGIVMAEGSRTVRTNNSGATTNTTIQTNSKGFFAAVLEEDSQIKSGVSVVFYLIEDCTFDGVNFKKNSILYGQASLRDNVFDIYISQIMNAADSRVYSVSNIVVYDEKYKKGLATGGNLNESVKEGVNQTSTETSNSLTSDPTIVGGSTTVGIAAKALNNTIRALSSKKEPYINRQKGYKIFIKQE